MLTPLADVAPQPAYLGGAAIICVAVILIVVAAIVGLVIFLNRRSRQNRQ